MREKISVYSKPTTNIHGYFNAPDKWCNTERV